MRVFLLYPTHTTRHLASALAALAHQTEPPDGVVLTCDNDLPEIAETAEDAWTRARQRCPGLPPLLYTARAHAGEPRLNQVRNNGLRALDREHALAPDDLVVIIDGDTALEPAGVAKHRALARGGAELTIPFRIDLTEQETPMFGSDRVIDEGFPDLASVLTDERLGALATRRTRYEKQLALKRLPVLGSTVKAHKPKIIGGHHAVGVRVMRAINGYDEGYVGYGYDDDDLARRAHGVRPRPRVAIAVGEIHAFHLYHPTRAPQRPTDSPGYERFRRRNLPVRAERGWDSPIDQPEPNTSVFDGASA